MKNSLLLLLAAALLLFDGFITTTDAQRGRVAYEDLLNINVAPALYLDHHVIPATEANPENVMITFKMGYEALRFRRITSANRPAEAPSGTEFFANVNVSIEIYKDEDGDLRPDRLESIQHLERLSWSTTAYAEDFSATRKADVFVNGFKKSKLDPGNYLMSVRIDLDGSRMRIQPNYRRFTVTDFSGNENFPIHLIADDGVEHSSGKAFQLLNQGNIVWYGEDFSVLLHLPENTGDDLRLVVTEVERSGGDITRRDVLHEHDLSADDIFTASSLNFRHDDDEISLFAEGTGNEIRLVKVLVPNKKFPNTRFKIELKDGNDVIAKRNVNSLWLDIPRSLLNIDVALEMMQYIVSREEFQQLRRGSERDRKRRFREFWADRDPTPDTDFNELMVEFYKRVDIAFDRFSTPGRPGFDTDQGKIFLRYGEPLSIDRRFPSGAPVREVWEYENRRFVFEATSGFGDYVLVNN